MAFPVVADVAERETGGTNTTTFTADKPVNLADGDYWFIFASIDGDIVITWPDGTWTEVYQDGVGGSGGASGGLAYKRFADASTAPATVDLTTSASEKGSLISFRLSGADDTNPIDALGAVGAENAASYTVGGLTTTVDDCLLMILTSTDTNDPGITFTEDTGWTEILEGSGSDPGGMTSWGLASKEKATAGVEAGASWSQSAAQEVIHAMVAFAPGAAAPSDPETPDQALALGDSATASAPDAAPLRITGDLDLRIWLDIDWNIDGQELIGRWQGPSQFSYLFHMPGIRNLSLFLTTDGLSGSVVQASRQLPAGVVDDPLQVRVTWRASDGRTQFFYFSEGAWVQVGSDATLNIGAIHAGTAPLTIGDNIDALQGHVFTAEVRDGIDGTIVASPDFTEDGPWLLGDDSNTAARNDAQSNPWSLTGTAVIVNFVPGSYVFFDLTDMPVDFDTADTASITVRTRGVNIDTPITLYAQIFQSDEVTPLSDEVQVVSETVDTSFANHNVAFTGLNTTAGKAIWDNARVRFRWEI